MDASYETVPRPPVTAGYLANFDTLLRAAGDNRLALLDVQRVTDGKSVAAVVAISGPDEHGEATFVPLAIMIEGDRYELYRAPDPNGGYFAE